MNARDIMAGNLVCFTTGIDPERAKQALAASDQSQKIYDIVDHALEGPCGTVELQCDCEARDGVEYAIELISKAPTGALTKEGEDAVREDRQYLLRQLQQSSRNEMDDLVDMLTGLGFKVTDLR